MYKILYILLFCISSMYSIENQKPLMWINMDKEEPSNENNFDLNKRVFNTTNSTEAIGITIMEGLLNSDKLVEEKKFTTDFKHLKEFDNSLSKK